MEAGADVDAGDLVSGKTPLHVAVERNLEEMVTLLIREAQVDVTRPDFSDMTPVDIADNCKSAAIKRILSKENKRQS